MLEFLLVSVSPVKDIPTYNITNVSKGMVTLLTNGSRGGNSSALMRTRTSNIYSTIYPEGITTVRPLHHGYQKTLD